MFYVLRFRFLSYLLALTSIVLIWYQLDTKVINMLFEDAEGVVKWLSQHLAQAARIEMMHAEALLLNKMHLDSKMVVSIFVVIWMAILLVVLRRPVMKNLWSLLLTLFFVHVFLIMAWLFAPTVTGWWYDLHTGIVKAALRAFELHKTETVFMKLLQPHSLLVFMEAFMLYSFIVSRVSVKLRLVDRDP